MLLQRIRQSGGYGIHSPFAYNLITKIIRNRCRYYCWDEIELERKKLFFKDEAIAALARRASIPPLHGALIFKLANCFKSKTILQVGPTLGLSTLYLTAYAQDTRCISLENRPDFAEISSLVYEETGKTSIDIRTGDLKATLPQALEELKQPDFIFFAAALEASDCPRLFEECVKYAGADTVFVFDAIDEGRQKRDCWQTICNHPATTVCIDLSTIGIAFFNPKLYKRTYRVYL